MENIILNVRPDELTAKAGEISTEKSTIITLMDDAKREIDSLKGVYKSEASDEYQRRFAQIYSDIDNMLAIISEYISDLTDAANRFAAAEVEVKNVVAGLPTEGVFGD